MNKKLRARIKKLTDGDSQNFADKNGISKKTATTFLNALYSKGKEAGDFNRLFYRAERWIRDTKMKDLINKLTKDQVSTLVDEMVKEDIMYASKSEVAYSEKMTGVQFNELKFAEPVPAGKVFTAGEIVEIQIMRTGKWKHEVYGEFEIGKKDLKEVVKNFKNDERGIELAVDENHEDNHRALAWYKELNLKGEAIFAKLELTTLGAELLTQGAYKYFSPEIMFTAKNDETGEMIKNLLIGGAFTNRPYFKNMDGLMASENAADQSSTQKDQNFLLFNKNSSMKKLIELIAEFAEKTSITEEQKASLEAAFAEVPESMQTDELQASYDGAIAKFSEEDPEEDPEEEEEDPEEDPETDPDEGIQETEPDDKGMVTMKASEFAELQKSSQLAAKLKKEKRKRKFTDTVQKMVFSDANKEGVLLPKAKGKVIEFMMTLDKSQNKAFSEIIGGLRKHQFGENGHGDDAGDEDAPKPKNVKYFMEKMQKTEEEAIECAKALEASE